jgi:epoxyqueuosine reductase
MDYTVDFSVLLREGLKFKMFSTRHLAELQQEIQTSFQNGHYGEEYTQTYLHRFNFAAPKEPKNVQSIIIVAMPRHPTKAIFNWNGQKLSFMLPPTYTAYDEKRLHVETLVAKAVGKAGFKIAATSLPLKLLAVRSGLAEYGRNNIAYVEGMGSFMRLTALYTDMPVESDNWQEAKEMETCRNCSLCQNACPTGAITKDQFLLHAEKCLTYHNEKDSSIPFPDWIRPEWHNCIIGCIRCQAACPKNKPYLTQVEDTVEFTESETKVMLKGTPCEKMPEETVKKMQRLSLTDYYKELPRNLTVLLQKRVKL